MLENGVYIIKGNGEIEKIKLFNKTKCSSCIRFNCVVFSSMDPVNYLTQYGYVDLFKSTVKLHLELGHPLEYKIEDFVRKYECDL